jgi:hypothetical protein
MELIPILSMIILVATIATFILSISAYILYKLREKRGRVATPATPREIEAELFAPQVVTTTQAEQYAAVQPRFLERPTGAGQYRRPTYGVQTPPAAPPAYAPRYATPQPQPAAARRQGGEYIAPQQQQQERARQGSNKYMTYTSDGYVASKEDKTGGALKWR